MPKKLKFLNCYNAVSNLKLMINSFIFSTDVKFPESCKAAWLSTFYD